MACAIIEMDSGYGHIRGSGVKACDSCGVLAEYQCDFPMGKGKTCDAHLCEKHAIPQGKMPSTQLVLFEAEEPAESDLHFCPAHEAMVRRGVIPGSRSKTT